MRDVVGEREVGRGGFVGVGFGRGFIDWDWGVENEVVGVNIGGEEEVWSGRSVFVCCWLLFFGERVRDGVYGDDVSGFRRRGGYDWDFVFEIWEED